MKITSSDYVLLITVLSLSHFFSFAQVGMLCWDGLVKGAILAIQLFLYLIFGGELLRVPFKVSFVILKIKFLELENVVDKKLCSETTNLPFHGARQDNLVVWEC